MKQGLFAFLLAGSFTLLATVSCGPTTPPGDVKAPSATPSPSTSATPVPAITPNPANQTDLVACRAALICVSEKTTGATSTQAKEHHDKLSTYSSDQQAGVCRSYIATAGLLGCK